MSTKGNTGGGAGTGTGSGGAGTGTGSGGAGTGPPKAHPALDELTIRLRDGTDALGRQLATVYAIAFPRRAPGARPS